MSLTAIETELVNIGALLGQTLGTVAAANNPAYSSILSNGKAVLASISASVNPTGAAAITTLAGDTAAAIQPATAAISTVLSKTATPTQKASAIATIIGEAEQLIPEAITVIESIFKKTPAAS